MMEGETSELEIDSELVMSFYDQYQVSAISSHGFILLSNKSVKSSSFDMFLG